MVWNNGCASKSSDKLCIWSMWAGDEGKFFLDTLREFERAHPGIQCENLGAVDDQKSVRAIVAGAPPDLLTLKDPLFLGTLAANDAFEPLDSFLSDIGLTEADFAPGSLSQCTINGRLYAVPYLIDVAGLLINNKVFRENGLDPKNPPCTTEELEVICKRLTKRGIDGRLERIGLRPPETLAFLTPSGAEYISPDGKTASKVSTAATISSTWTRRQLLIRGNGTHSGSRATAPTQKSRRRITRKQPPVQKGRAEFASVETGSAY
jgi:ABC-type glycerol-3-phosphate transport system substrate-binding protein